MSSAFVVIGAVRVNGNLKPELKKTTSWNTMGATIDTDSQTTTF